MKRPIKQTPKQDALGRRFSDIPQSTGKAVRLTANDIELFKLYHRHGDLPVTYAHIFLKTMGLARDYQSTVKRHGVLFHENNTPHKGTYLDRDPNQFETKNANYHCAVHRLTERSKQVLKDEGYYTEFTPKSSTSWKHDFLRACFSFTIEIECLREPDRYEYIPHHEIVERIGIDEFAVEANVFRPDLIYGIRYKNKANAVRLFMVEIDCKTEQLHRTKKNQYRNFETKLERYRKYIKGGLYKADFQINGGVMLQVLTVNQTHMHYLMDLVDTESYMLFNYVNNFDYGFVPPKNEFPLFYEPWLRPGNDEYSIAEP